MIRCIIAEDEHILRRGLVLTTDWESLGCELIGEAGDGLQALELVKQLSPDLVITDIRMPIIDGLELIKQCTMICEAEFIIMSGYNDFNYAKRALQLGVTDYLCKPIDEDEFATAIKGAGEKIREKHEQEALICKLNTVNNSNILLFKEYLSNSTSPKNQYIDDAVSFIEENYNKNITIKDVCKSLLISESYLTKLFKEYTEYSFVSYLTNYRIKKACELLTNIDIKIYMVAEKVGYKDQRYFSVLFKKIIGMTPSEFKYNQPT